MSNYELMLIVNPAVSQEERDASINEVKELLTNNSAVIVKEDIWWDKKMAYQINKTDRAFYVLFDLEIEGKTLKSITQSMNLNQNIWRHMFVRKDA